MNERDAMDSIRPYIDSNGLVSPDGHISQNGIRFTCEWVEALQSSNIAAWEHMDRLRIRVMECEKEPGLFNRTPGGNEQEQWDDYIALCATFKDVARRVMLYGKAHSWNFNNVNPGKFTFLS